MNTMCLLKSYRVSFSAIDVFNWALANNAKIWVCVGAVPFTYDDPFPWIEFDERGSLIRSCMEECTTTQSEGWPQFVNACSEIGKAAFTQIGPMQPFGKKRATVLWDGRTVQGTVHPTAQEHEYVDYVFDALVTLQGGHLCWMDAFRFILQGNTETPEWQLRIAQG